MSAFGQKQTCAVAKAHVCFGPCVDGSQLARTFFTYAALVGAAMCSAFRCGSHDRWPECPPRIRSRPKARIRAMRWHKWVVLVAGSTGSALRAVRPPNLHITPVTRRDLVYAASATGSLYRSPLAIMAQTIRAILLASAMAATLVGRRASNAVSHGRCLVPWILA